MAVGDDDPVVGISSTVDRERVAGFAARQPQHAGRKCKQREHADRRQHRQEAQDVWFGAAVRARRYRPRRQPAAPPPTAPEDTAVRAAPALRSTARRAAPAELSVMPCVVIPALMWIAAGLLWCLARPARKSVRAPLHMLLRPARRAARTQDLAGNLGDAVRSALRATIETIARVMTAEACGTAALDALALRGAPGQT